MLNIQNFKFFQNTTRIRGKFSRSHGTLSNPEVHTAEEQTVADIQDANALLGLDLDPSIAEACRLFLENVG